MSLKKIINSKKYGEATPEVRKKSIEGYFNEVILPQAKKDKAPIEQVRKAYFKKALEFESRRKLSAPEPKEKWMQDVSDILVPGYTGLSKGQKPVDLQVDEAGTALKRGAEHSAMGHIYGPPTPYTPKNKAQELLFDAASVGADIPLYTAGAMLGSPGGPLVAAGGAFALPAGIKKVLSDTYQKGRIEDLGTLNDRMKGAATETIKGLNTGMLMGGMGKAVDFLAGKAVSPAVKSLLKKSKSPLEIGTMVAAGSAMEGRIPEAKDFLHAAMTLGILKGAAFPIAKSFKKIYEATGRHPEQVVKKIKDSMTQEEFNAIPAEQLPKIIEKIEFTPTPQESVMLRRGKLPFIEQFERQMENRNFEKPNVDFSYQGPQKQMFLPPKPPYKIGPYHKQNKQNVDFSYKGPQTRMFGEKPPVKATVYNGRKLVKKPIPKDIKKAVKREGIEETTNQQANTISQGIMEGEIKANEFFKDPQSFMDPQLMGKYHESKLAISKVMKKVEKEIPQNESTVDKWVRDLIKEEKERQQAYERQEYESGPVVDFEPKVAAVRAETPKPETPKPEMPKAAKAEPKTHEVFYEKISGENVEVIKNPTYQDIKQIKKEYLKDYPKVTDPATRTTYDNKGNEYWWRSDKAVHREIENKIAKRFNVKLNQQQSEIYPKSGELFTKDLTKIYRQMDQPAIENILNKLNLNYGDMFFASDPIMARSQKGHAYPIVEFKKDSIPTLKKYKGKPGLEFASKSGLEEFIAFSENIDSPMGVTGKHLRNAITKVIFKKDTLHDGNNRNLMGKLLTQGFKKNKTPEGVEFIIPAENVNPVKSKRPTTSNYGYLKRMGELKKLVGEEKYYKTLKALGYEKSNYILDKKVQNQVIRELSQPSIATELRKDRPPLKSKLEPGENVRFKKFLNAFETRLGKEDAVNVYSNVLGIDPIQRPVGVMKNQLAKLESLDAKRKVLTELAKAIERKKEYGKYGSATKIVKQKKRFGKLSEPLYECEHNIIKLGKDLAKPQKWLGTHARVFIDQLPKPLKDLLWHGMHKADHNSKVEYMKLEKDVDYFSRGMDRGFNKRIGIYAAKQQEMGIATLKSMGYKDKEINRKLSPKEMSLYNWMRKNFESMYDRIQEERVKAGAEPFPKVKNYFTFMRQMNEGTLLGLNPIKTDPAIFLESKFAHPRTTSFKYRKAREKAIQPIDLNAGRVFKKYMHDATFHVHTAPILSKTRDMISKVGEYDLKKEKPHLYTFLSEWSDEVAGVKFPSEFKNPKVDSALRFLCNNIAYATLSGMVRSAIIQPAAIRNTWVRIGLSDTLKGVAQGLNPTKAREAMSKSNNLLIREFDVNWEEAQTSLTTAYQRGQAAVGKQGYKPLAFLDMVTARATWLGSFEKAKRTMSEKESIRFADEIVTTTQASASRMDRSPAQRTALGRAATLFNTFVIMDYEFLKHDVMGINNPKMTMKDAIKKSMTYLISTALISSLYEDVIGVNSPFPTPVNAFMDAKDEGATNAEASYQVSKELLQMFPVWGGSLEYGSSPAGAAVDTIERMVKYGSKGALPDLGTAGQITGIPGSVQGNKYLKNRRKGMTIWDALVGSKKKPKKGYKPY